MRIVNGFQTPHLSLEWCFNKPGVPVLKQLTATTVGSRGSLLNVIDKPYDGLLGFMTLPIKFVTPI